MQKIEFEKITDLNYQSKESYKALRTNLQFCGSDIKTIVFTSCAQNEGKSSVSFNLASSLAENGKRVILIDADLRKSVLMGRHKVGTSVNGLSHYLSGQCELEEAVYETNIDNMDVILCSSFAPNPAELLGHDRFKSMLSKLRDEYDYVLIDSPPLGAVIDSAIIAPLCDGAVIVVSHSAESYRFVQDVKRQLEKSGCKILGAILNKVPVTKKGYYGKYYGKYKYYGQQYGQEYGQESNMKLDAKGN